jgi:hypothetical protein
VDKISFCHSERSKIVREADDLAKSRNLLSARTTTEADRHDAAYATVEERRFSAA